MDETPFYRTRMGRQFFEATVPRLVEQLDALNRTLAAKSKPVDDPIADELLLATNELVNATREVLDVEIVPGSDTTTRTFRNLRERMETARAAADRFCGKPKCRS